MSKNSPAMSSTAPATSAAGGEIGWARAGLAARSTAESEAHRPAGQRRGPVLGEDGREVSGDVVDESGVTPVRERRLLMRDDERNRDGSRLERIVARITDRRGDVA